MGRPICWNDMSRSRSKRTWLGCNFLADECSLWEYPVYVQYQLIWKSEICNWMGHQHTSEEASLAYIPFITQSRTTYQYRCFASRIRKGASHCQKLHGLSPWNPLWIPWTYLETYTILYDNHLDSEWPFLFTVCPQARHLKCDIFCNLYCDLILRRKRDPKRKLDKHLLKHVWQDPPVHREIERNFPLSWQRAKRVHIGSILQYFLAPSLQHRKW